uniref:ZP domain-containing protein n=1 Tax=Cyclopterus lumpus TaxID=8103 RepID=A0A8C2XBT5_CYCLU
MAKHWGVTSLVALALLACLTGTEVEAQGQGWMPPKGPPQNPQVFPESWPVRPYALTTQVSFEKNVKQWTVMEDANKVFYIFNLSMLVFMPPVTVQCTKNGQFIVVVARDATVPNIDLESILLLSKASGCTHVDSNSDFAIYNFPVTSCGTVVLEEPGVIIYENKMFSSYEVETGRRGVITRDSHYELLFQCRYIGTTVQTVVVEVLPLGIAPLSVAVLGPIRVELRLGSGQCISKGCNEVDVAYDSYYTEADYPVRKVLRDPVYVEVQLLEKTDPNLVLTLGRCWATTKPNPHSLPQWDILTDGCPCRNDNYLSSLVPVGAFSGLDFPSHYRRFLFKMFTFVDPTSVTPMREQVYIHCSTAVCTTTGSRSCEPICYRKKRDVMAVDQTSSEPKVVVSVGPVMWNSRIWPRS